MLELFLLWKLSDVRDELYNYDTEDSFGVIVLFMVLQVFTWPLLLGAVLGKKFGWRYGIPAAVVPTTVLLLVDWGLYLAVGVGAFFLLAGIFAWMLTFAEE